MRTCRHTYLRTHVFTDRQHGQTGRQADRQDRQDGQTGSQRMHSVTYSFAGQLAYDLTHSYLLSCIHAYTHTHTHTDRRTDADR